jgi:hypothetical protein
MVIFGGDRHKMCFNDLFQFNIEEVIAKQYKF